MSLCPNPDSDSAARSELEAAGVHSAFHDPPPPLLMSDDDATTLSEPMPPAPGAPEQLRDMLERELQIRCLKIGPALLEYGISQLDEMRHLLLGLTDDDFEETSEFRRDVPLTKFQVRSLRLWKALTR